MLTEEEAYTFQPPPSTFSSDLMKVVHHDSSDFTDCADVVFILTNESEDDNSEKPKVAPPFSLFVVDFCVLTI